MEEEWTFLADEKVQVAGVAPKDDHVPLTGSSAEDLAPPMMGASVYFSSLEENLFLLRGEQLDARCPKCTGVVELTGKLTGTLYMTNYQLIFKEARIDDRAPSPHSDAAHLCPSEGEPCSSEELKIPLAIIDRAEASLENTASVCTKHFASYMFCFPSPAMFQSFLKRVQENVAGIGRLDAQSAAFAFANREEFKRDGWQGYSPASEYFQRQAIDPALWRITHANDKFALCKSYPREFVVPSSVSDAALASASRFRSGARGAALCWVNPRSSASISRSSQPMVGITGARNPDDEELVRAIGAANPHRTPLYIVDCRPWSAAVANRARGAGTESAENYAGCKVCFMNIDNIHTMRDSLSALYELLRQSGTSARSEHRWLSALDSTRWLEHVRLVLSGAVKIAKLVELDRCSVLVHCSDGWDRTAQLTSLAQLLLDPFYRTMKGFQVLVEKEWLSFGHRFADRCGHGKSLFADAECSPVFLQFLDCVWQATQQFQCAFEFTEGLLVALLDSVYSCRFGTFLGNNEYDRARAGLAQRTRSVWAYIHSRRASFLNPLYQPQPGALFPVCSVAHIAFWGGYYLRFHGKTPQMRMAESARDHLRAALATRNSKLERELATLRRLLDSQTARATALESELTSAQREKEVLRQQVRGVSCKVYLPESAADALSGAPPTSPSRAPLAQVYSTAAAAAGVSLEKLCADLEGLNIIEDYSPLSSSTEPLDPAAASSAAASPLPPRLERDELLTSCREAQRVQGGEAVHSLLDIQREFEEAGLRDDDTVMLEVSDLMAEHSGRGGNTRRFPVRLQDVLVLVSDYIQRGLLRSGLPATGTAVW